MGKGREVGEGEQNVFLSWERPATLSTTPHLLTCVRGSVCVCVTEAELQGPCAPYSFADSGENLEKEAGSGKMHHFPRKEVGLLDEPPGAR